MIGWFVFFLSSFFVCEYFCCSLWPHLSILNNKRISWLLSREYKRKAPLFVVFVIFFNLYRILLCILSQALVQAIGHWFVFFLYCFLCKDKSNWNWNVVRGTLLIENSCSARWMYVCACVQLMKHVCDFAVCHQLMLFLDKSLISDSLNTVHNVHLNSCL